MGTVKKCMIEPVDALVKILDRYAIKVALFKDAGYLSNG